MSEDSKARLTDALSESLGLGAILREAREQTKKGEASGYWIHCPSCGRRVVKKQLAKNGCYLCGWKEGESDQQALPYRTPCPKCGRLVITEELVKNGCFICGYKPEDTNNSRQFVSK